MASSQLLELVNSRADVVPFTLEQYHRMIETGILPEGEPIELLDGYLIRKDRSKAGQSPMTVGYHHVWVVRQLTILLEGLSEHRAHLQIQAPLTIPPDSEPEPDAAVVVGMPDEYRDRHPGPADVSCVFEVADSSLNRDRGTKMRIYADAGIGQYVIVNLLEHRIEEYRESAAGSGRYQAQRVLERGEVLRIDVGGGAAAEVPVDRLLP